ncbi:DUF4007 family protein [Nitrincola alkalilacustris]|uniref:DUF4007 family protein n=1 Tax=Nitrincola alkalilacustris TaxID=1571224 RepID=UPI00124CCD04|nr:DUF4007 family protein [Nitrincola alkalilacustris]
MKPRFTGHDTFPLRHGWLFKAIDIIKNNELLSVSDSDQASRTIEILGVGKNMVNAIRYWAEVSKVVETRLVNRSSVQAVTSLGNYIFDPQTGLDPYLEDVGTLWLLHFLLCFDDEQLTAYRYFFNYSNSIYFDKNKFINDLLDDLVRLTGSASVNKATVKKDVDCFLATYAEKHRTASKNKTVDEDHFASPLTELGLVKDLGRGFYQCDLDDRPSLPLSIFTFALVEYFKFANAESQSRQVSFEDVLTKPLSPGRIFKLSESELGRLIDEAVSESNGSIVWVDSLGLKQVAIDATLLENPKDLLDDYYRGYKR